MFSSISFKIGSTQTSENVVTPMKPLKEQNTKKGYKTTLTQLTSTRIYHNTTTVITARV